MQANKPSDNTTRTRTNPLDSLVTAGTITQEQEDAIKSAFESAMSVGSF
jgi:hypothetical protein